MPKKSKTIHLSMGAVHHKGKAVKKHGHRARTQGHLMHHHKGKGVMSLNSYMGP